MDSATVNQKREGLPSKNRITLRAYSGICPELWNALMKHIVFKLTNRKDFDNIISELENICIDEIFPLPIDTVFTEIQLKSIIVAAVYSRLAPNLEDYMTLNSICIHRDMPDLQKLKFLSIKKDKLCPRKYQYAKDALLYRKKYRVIAKEWNESIYSVKYHITCVNKLFRRHVMRERLLKQPVAIM